MCLFVVISQSHLPRFVYTCEMVSCSNDVCPYRFSSTFQIHQSGKIDWGVRKYAIASLLAENQSQRVSKTSSCVQLCLGQTSGCGRVLAVLVYRTEVAKRKRAVWELIWDSQKKAYDSTKKLQDRKTSNLCPQVNFFLNVLSTTLFYLCLSFNHSPGRILEINVGVFTLLATKVKPQQSK